MFRYQEDFVIAEGLTQAIVVAASSGDNALVAAPGVGKQLVVACLKGQRTSGSAVTTAVLVKAGATSIDYGDFSNDIPGQVFWEAASKLQLRVLPENTALNVNHSAANSITYTVRYLILNM